MTLRPTILTCLLAALATSMACGADYTIKAGSTDVTVYARLENDDGGITMLPSIAFDNAALKVRYHRGAGQSLQTISPVTQTVSGTHTDGGWIALDSTNAPGIYRLDLPDDVCAAGISRVVVTIKMDTASGTWTDQIDIDLVGYDPTDGVRLGMSALPSATPGASGGVVIAGTNSGATSFTSGVTISNSSGTALTLASSGGNGHGLAATAHGVGSGFLITGGSAGGVGLLASSSGASGAIFASTGSGFGLSVLGANGQAGLNIGLMSGTGPGVKIAGGATAGNGIDITTTSGHGLSVAATGSSKHGVTISGGNSGTSDGLKLAAGTGGVALRADITGISGNLTGSVGSISGVTFPTDFDELMITSGRVNADVTHWLGDEVVAPAVDGVPEVDVTHVLGSPVCD